MHTDALAAAMERLRAYRASFAPGDIVDDASGLGADDLDLIAACLHETIGAAPVRDMQLDERPGSERARQESEASRLSDNHLVGTHRAMQDGVDDTRKDALGDELTRRGLGR